jgi:N-acetylmuramoyl-L-alanine amidase
MPWSSVRGAVLSVCLLTSLFGQSAPPAPIQPQAPAQPSAPLVVIDPAHGGSDPGAALNVAIPEKDVTLVIARRLRQELAARGFRTQLVRDGDTTISTDQRAAIVNALDPALYVAVHATSQGRGICLYTAMLASGGANRGPFADWRTAQAPALPRSQSILQLIAAAIQKTRFPVRSLDAPLRPLNNVTAPAVAIEIAPTTSDVSQLASTDYQEMVCAVLANGISSSVPVLRSAWGSEQ